MSHIGLTKDGHLCVRGIFNRDLSQSIAHMGLVIWNFYRFSWRPLCVELQPFKVWFSPYILDFRRIYDVRRFVSRRKLNLTKNELYIRNQWLTPDWITHVSPIKNFWTSPTIGVGTWLLEIFGKKFFSLIRTNYIFFDSASDADSEYTRIFS